VHCADGFERCLSFHLARSTRYKTSIGEEDCAVR